MIFSKKLKSPVQETLIGRLAENVGSIVNNNLTGAGSVTSLAVSTESLSEDQTRLFRGTLEGLRTSLEAMSARMGISLEEYQYNAGVVAGVIAADPKAFFSAKQSMLTGNESTHLVTGLSAEGFDERPLALEAYDDRDNKNAAMFSIAYNIQSSRQDEFGETLFPTIVLSPDQVGLTITVRLMQVYNELFRQISGAIDQYNKKNIIRAVADYTILKNEMTRIIPVYRPESADKFVDTGLVATRTVDLEGEAIVTSPLAMGVKLSLLGISQTDTLLQSGVMDITDSIEPAIRLNYLYIKVGADILKFDVSNLPLSEFTYATQANFMKMQLNFDTTSLLINKDTKQYDGSALVDLASVVTNDLIVRVEANVTGSVNTELGDTVAYANGPSVFTVQNNAGELVALTAAPAADLVTLFATAEIIGYELISFRSNLNRRQRGQLIDTTFYTQAYNVYFGSPITAIHPVTMDGQTDATDLHSLVTATRMRTSNSAVKALIEAANAMKEYIDARDYQGVPPDVLGAGRFFVKPVYFEEQIDMNDIVDSIKSHERAADIQAALVNKIRDYAYRMYRNSEYKAAADAMAGGLAPVPVVIIATDPVLAEYLTVTGDLRTLGNEFEVRVVNTLDYRVTGKIFVTFGVFDEGRNTTPNPLSFGNMIWSPEVTVVLPISRNGQISKELAVSPRFRHIVNLPVLTALTIDNVPDVVSKVPLHFKSV